ncbi:hypothetical protein L596_016989 [Steinernema carpocapsae]|uniref:Uncharacterized protein n=1 Tax=Steinernema carpocapsae TaxID=34508 RepID=A0A4U5N0E8_STECR|nr:hypothetical protein L596_016989 [Steinernema carpocapsae]
MSRQHFRHQKRRFRQLNGLNVPFLLNSFSVSGCGCLKTKRSFVAPYLEIKRRFLVFKNGLQASTWG